MIPSRENYIECLKTRLKVCGERNACCRTKLIHEGYPRAIIPGKHMKADVYLDKGKLGDLHGAWLAKVDLTKLGLTARWKRKMGDIKYVYVKTGSQDARNVQIR